MSISHNTYKSEEQEYTAFFNGWDTFERSRIKKFRKVMHTVSNGIVLQRNNKRETVVLFQCTKRAWICIYHSRKPLWVWYRVGQLKELISELPHLPYINWEVFKGDYLIDKFKVRDRIMHPDAQV